MKATAIKVGGGKHILEKGADEEARRDHLRAFFKANIDQRKRDINATKDRIWRIESLFLSQAFKKAGRYNSSRAYKIRERNLVDPLVAVQEKEEMMACQEIVDFGEAALKSDERKFCALLKPEEAKRWNCMQKSAPYVVHVDRLWPEVWAVKKLTEQLPLAVAVEIQVDENDDDHDDIQEVQVGTDDEELLQASIAHYYDTSEG